MADDLGRNPLYIDTASATAKTLMDGTTTMKLKINQIVWVQPTSDNDECEVQQANGDQIYKFDPATANENQTIRFGTKGFWSTGLKVPTLDSGHLLVFLM